MSHRLQDKPHAEPANTQGELPNHLGDFIALLLKVLCSQTYFKYAKPDETP